MILLGFLEVLNVNSGIKEANDERARTPLQLSLSIVRLGIRPASRAAPQRRLGRRLDQRVRAHLHDHPICSAIGRAQVVSSGIPGKSEVAESTSGAVRRTAPLAGLHGLTHETGPRAPITTPRQVGGGTAGRPRPHRPGGVGMGAGTAGAGNVPEEAAPPDTGFVALADSRSSASCRKAGLRR